MTNTTGSTQVADANANATTETTAGATQQVVVKEPSKISKGKAIFYAEFANRKSGKFATNKAFRRCVRERMVAECEISWASSGSIFNAAKKEAEAEAEKSGEDIGLGRDPKKEKPVKQAGKPGRPAGSKNKPKAVEPVAAVAPVAENTAAGTTEPGNQSTAAPVSEVIVAAAANDSAQTAPAAGSVQKEADPV